MEVSKAIKFSSNMRNALITALCFKEVIPVFYCAPVIIPKLTFFNSACILKVAGDVFPIKYTADSFFFLHTINAYEEKDQVCI